MAGPVLNVRLFAKSKNASTKSYTLPALFMMMGSPTLERAVGSNDALVLDKRIADEQVSKMETQLTLNCVNWVKKFHIP
jgi:hypothetical protein